MTSKHIAVLAGGFSTEREISLASGEGCAAALDAEGYQVSFVDVGYDIAEVLAKLKPDVAFNALHGPFGEDGTIQGILEYLGIAYTHSGVLASALAMNKEKAKKIVALAGVPVAESLIVDRRSIGNAHPMAPPYVVKPVNEGSSFGVIIVRDTGEQPTRIFGAEDWGFGDSVMVERYVPGRELTCAVIGDKALDVCEIITAGHAFYDHDSKYAPGGSEHVVPARIPDDIAARIKDLALTAHREIGCRGVSRSDFRYDDRAVGGGEIIWLEINNQPGMTPTSLVPDIAARAGMSFAELVRWIAEDASCPR
ncbi:D-alanine--D-alanine ligase [Sphingopyxis sp. EG6]|uniref:D-alanine--D-alanine ligase n=1 Tax=Sphingopyxis sp. EG6 TaxID=1874061 RepID=UPI000DC61C05|nr:D-alanine--D-alanine ligase [Sphingopyxis sp. EG6]BBB10561.1 D-alanine-D-alanine ligase [Sphingopyxis sp. EG6]